MDYGADYQGAFRRERRRSSTDTGDGFLDDLMFRLGALEYVLPENITLPRALESIPQALGSIPGALEAIPGALAARGINPDCLSPSSSANSSDICMSPEGIYIIYFNGASCWVVFSV